jgi:hypothetical protein
VERIDKALIGGIGELIGEREIIRDSKICHASIAEAS